VEPRGLGAMQMYPREVSAATKPKRKRVYAGKYQRAA